MVATRLRGGHPAAQAMGAARSRLPLAAHYRRGRGDAFPNSTADTGIEAIVQTAPVENK